MRLLSKLINSLGREAAELRNEMPQTLPFPRAIIKPALHIIKEDAQMGILC